MTFSSASALGQEATAFAHVHVVPMDAERVLRDYTVVVVGDEIVALGPSSEVELPPGARIIDGEGAYLMPGLADMHAHLNIDPSPDFMRVFLAEGTTTVRNLNALPSHLRWKREVLRGERIGPTIYTSGPMIVGPPEWTFVWTFRALVMGSVLLLGGMLWLALWAWRRIRAGREAARRLRRFLLPGALTLVALGLSLLLAEVIPLSSYMERDFPFAYVPESEEQARAEVRRQAAAGCDLIKVYDYMTREQYLGAIEEARSEGIYVVGHLDHGVQAPLAAGLREVAHVDEFLDVHLVGEMSGGFEALPVNHATIPETVALVVAHDALVLVNMSTDVSTYEYLEAGPSYFERPEYASIRPERIEEWREGRMVAWQGQVAWRRDTVQPFLEEMTMSLHEAGVPLLVGTDTGAEGSVPGQIHRELELLVRAGLTPYEALSAATKNACASVNRSGIDDEFGQVVVGQRADLILLEANPLEEVAATRRRLGVMTRGRWFTQAELERLVADLVATY